MTPTSNATLLGQLRWRYATKKFDAARKVSATDWAALEDSLILTPSSCGLQPWKFIVVTSPTVRQQLLGVSWGQAQVVDCSHHVVLAARTEITVRDVDEYVESMAVAHGRTTADPSIAGFRKMVVGFISTPNFPALNWASKQVYIALGNLMTSAAMIGIDTCPMEGIDPAKYDEILGLTGTGFTTVVACAVGYRADDDKHAALAKVRYPSSKVVTHI